MQLARKTTVQAAALALLIGATACDSPEPDESEGEQTPEAQEEVESEEEPGPEPEPEPDPELEPEPDPEPDPEPEPVEIVGWAQHGAAISLKLYNPNESLGLSRAGFEVTLLGADGAILGVLGREGFPGALCCTIYQMPPEAETGLALDYFDGDEVSDIEFRLTDGWEVWDELEPPDIAVSDTSVRDSGFGVSLTGRLSTQDDEPINVWVIGSVDTPDGVLMVTGIVECVSSGDSRPFEVEGFLAEDAGPYELLAVSAYATSVPGSDRTFEADC